MVWAHALVSSLVRTQFTTYLIFNPTIQITIRKIQVETVDILSLVTNQMKFSSESWLFWIFNEANISANLWLRSSSLWQARISSGLQSSDLAILEFYVSVNSSIYEELVISWQFGFFFIKKNWRYDLKISEIHLKTVS